MISANNSPRFIDEAASVGSNATQITHLVGVVIVNFFTADYLCRCLSALSQQTRPADSIVLVNNGDRAGALDFVARDYPCVRVLEQDNIGFAAANNLAIAELDNHHWVALLNPDAFPAPMWLEQLLAAAEAEPDIAVFSSQLLQADNVHMLDGDGDTYHISGLAWRHHHGRLAREAGRVREVFSACAAAALYRRDALTDVGGFDAAYFCYFEDVDLGFRLRLRGYRCLQVPAAEVLHIGGAATGGKKHNNFALYHGHRNLVWTFVKNMPGCWFWLLLPLHALLNLVEIIWFAGKGYGGVMCRAKFDACKALPAIWAQRKKIQAGRVATPWSIIKRMSFWPFTLDGN